MVSSTEREVNISFVRSGYSTPTVSQKHSRSTTPDSSVNSDFRNAISALEASSALISTFKPCPFTYSAASIVLALSVSRSIFSFFFMWSSETGATRFTVSTSQSIAASMSLRNSRAKELISALKPSPVINLMALRSPSDTIGVPASMISTPRRSSCRAIISFCSGVNDTPGVCSPSRSVVSSIFTLSGFNSTSIPFPAMAITNLN